jgi:prephenate dehydrogenase
MALHKIGILGLGRVGGSLGLRLRERRLARELWAWDPDPHVAEAARVARVADRIARDPFTVVRGAQVVVAALSPAIVRGELHALAGDLSPGALVTTTSAIDAALPEEVEAVLPPAVAYVAGHPLFRRPALVEGYDATLFDDCVYCLLATPRTHRDALEFMAGLVSALGAQPFFPDAAELAGWVALLETLPQTLGLALHRTVIDALAELEIERAAGAAFYTVTAPVAAEQDGPDAWLTGRAMLLPALDAYIAELQRLRAAIAAGDTCLREETAALRRERRRLLARTAEQAEQAALAPAAGVTPASVLGTMLGFPRLGRVPGKDTREKRRSES